MAQRYYCVWMNNYTDSRDDEPIKVRAASEQEALEIARKYQPHRFSVGQAYRLNEFQKATNWPHTWATKFQCD